MFIIKYFINNLLMRIQHLFYYFLMSTIVLFFSEYSIAYFRLPLGIRVLLLEKLYYTQKSSLLISITLMWIRSKETDFNDRNSYTLIRMKWKAASLPCITFRLKPTNGCCFIGKLSNRFFSFFFYPTLH